MTKSRGAEDGEELAELKKSYISREERRLEGETSRPRTPRQPDVAQKSQLHDPTGDYFSDALT